MNILALEFSSEERSVAVLPDRGAGEPFVAALRASPRTLNAFQLIESALRQARMEREAIELLAVGLGPGSYTGIRAAISIAQAWQLARAVRLLGISSVECLAAQAQSEGISGRVAFVIDAQRNEFYVATYEIAKGGCQIIDALRIETFAAVKARAGAGEILMGPEPIGAFPARRLASPNAAALARLAVGRTDFVSGEAIEPIYLRETRFVKAPPLRILPTA